MCMIIWTKASEQKLNGPCRCFVSCCQDEEWTFSILLVYAHTQSSGKWVLSCFTELYKVRWGRRKAFLTWKSKWDVMIVSGCFIALRNKWKAKRAHTLVPLVRDGKRFASQPLLSELAATHFLPTHCHSSTCCHATWGRERDVSCVFVFIRVVKVDHVPYMSLCVTPQYPNAHSQWLKIQQENVACRNLKKEEALTLDTSSHILQWEESADRGLCFKILSNRFSLLRCFCKWRM